MTGKRRIGVFVSGLWVVGWFLILWNGNYDSFDPYAFVVMGIVPVAVLWGLAWVVSGFRTRPEPLRSFSPEYAREMIERKPCAMLRRKHDNGWSSGVVEYAGPWFLAGFTRSELHPIGKLVPDGTELQYRCWYTELQLAQQASDAMVRAKSSHPVCSASCGEWAETARWATSSPPIDLKSTVDY